MTILVEQVSARKCSQQTPCGLVLLMPRMLRYSDDILMAMSVVRGLPFERRIALDRVMRTLTGGHR